MPERIQLTGPPEQAAAQLWAHICEKTMLDGEKLQKLDSPADAAEYYVPKLDRAELESQNLRLVQLLGKMRAEREDIFEKNTVLEDACGKLMREKLYLQQQLAAAINTFTEHQKAVEERLKLIEQRSPATASDPSGPEHH